MLKLVDGNIVMCWESQWLKQVRFLTLWKGGLTDILGGLLLVIISSHRLEDVYTVDIAILTILYVH